MAPGGFFAIKITKKLRIITDRPPSPPLPFGPLGLARNNKKQRGINTPPVKSNMSSDCRPLAICGLPFENLGYFFYVTDHPHAALLQNEEPKCARASQGVRGCVGDVLREDRIPHPGASSGAFSLEDSTRPSRSPLSMHH